MIRLANLIMNRLTKSIIGTKLTPWCTGKVRTLTTSSSLNIKVVVCGASGGVGQPLSLLLKMSPFIEELALYDINDCPGVASDLSHINTVAKVTHFDKPALLSDALAKKDIVVITAGKPRDPGMTRADLFKFNAGIIATITEAMSKASPKAMLCIITNPVNSLMPVAQGILCKSKCYDPRRLFGITTLDVVRASTFVGELICCDPTNIVIPVIGGHSGTTIVPVFSQSSVPIDLPKDTMKALVERVQNGGSEVVNAKKGKGSATLSTAYAGARFVFALCRGMKGEQDIVECVMVESDLTDAQFLATPVILGPKGMQKNLGYGKLSSEECCLFNTAIKELIKEIDMGKQFLEGDSKEPKK